MYRSVSAVARHSCRVIFAQDQLSDSAMDAIGADEDIAIMYTPIRTVKIVNVLEKKPQSTAQELWESAKLGTEKLILHS